MVPLSVFKSSQYYELYLFCKLTIFCGIKNINDKYVNTLPVMFICNQLDALKYARLVVLRNVAHVHSGHVK